MNKTIPFSIAIFIAAFTLVADPAADLVTAGRDSLATNHTTAGLQTAYADFTSAVSMSPNNPTANALAAATRLLLLPQSPGGAAFLTGLGVSTTGRDIYNWTADFHRDANGNVVLPANLNTSAGIAAYTGSVLPAINASLVNLATITDTNFILNLSANETDSQDVTLDYGDIQLLRAFLYLADNFGHFLGAYNFSVVINHLRDLGQSDQLSFQRILSDYPSLFTLTSGAEVRASKIGLTNAIYSYFSASDFIRNIRTNGADRLFNLQTNDVDREATFRSNVAI